MARSVRRVTGLRETERRLAKLEKDVTKKAVGRRSLTAGGKVIADRMKHLAPKDEGELADGISVSTNLSKSQKSKHIKLDPVEVFAGAAATSNAVQQEFGNVNHAAQPYGRPAFDSTKHNALNVIVRTMAVDVDKTIDRQAKRNARKK